MNNVTNTDKQGLFKYKKMLLTPAEVKNIGYGSEYYLLTGNAKLQIVPTYLKCQTFRAKKKQK